MNAEFLQTPIEYLKGVGPNRASLLKTELGIHNFQDLVNCFPNRYIDRTQFYTINTLERNTSEVQLIGKITHIKMLSQQRGKRLVATFQDQTGTMELLWFKGHKWIKDNIKLNVPYVIFGKTNLYNRRFSMPHPEMELVEDHKKNLQSAMQPVYPSTEKLSARGISNRVFNKLMQQLFLGLRKGVKETLSEPLINRFDLISKNKAIFNIHFPQSQELLSKAQYRLKFEELFYIQLQLIRKKLLRKSKIKGYPFDKVVRSSMAFLKIICLLTSRKPKKR